jgi:hypothetical protein
LSASDKPKSAVAVAAGVKVQTDGQIDGRTIVFEDLLPDTPYDVRVVLADGTVLQGVDLGWYNEEPADPEAEPIGDDDRAQIKEILGVPRFYNKCDILALRGDHNRATALVRLQRDNGFHSDAGGEIIWRIELWYFKNQYGGWEAVAQQNKVLRRERFASKAAYDADAGKIRWTPELGGLRVSSKDAGGEGVRTIKLQDAAKGDAKTDAKADGEDHDKTDADGRSEGDGGGGGGGAKDTTRD